MNKIYENEIKKLKSAGAEKILELAQLALDNDVPFVIHNNDGSSLEYVVIYLNNEDDCHYNHWDDKYFEKFKRKILKQSEIVKGEHDER